MDCSRWRSCHLYYHGDGDLLLAGLVRPLVGALLRSGAVDRFFFVRYQLGGPHVRLRLRATAEPSGAVEAAVGCAAAEFFALHPSTRMLPAETVRRRTREILAADTAESDDRIHPDNSLRILPFVPEVDRYGGPALIGAALDFFTLSSVRALGCVAAAAGEPRSRQIPRILRLLAGQALGFARDAAELSDLLAYAAVEAGHPLAPFTARGDQTYEEQPEVFQRLLADAAEAAATGGSADSPVEEARRLAAAVDRAAPGARRRILGSHLHMAANRLGLRNPEEVWLGRVLHRAAGDAGAGLSGLARPLDGGGGLEDLLATALATLMRDPEVPSTPDASAFRGR
jgi:hypothetical protein